MNKTILTILLYVAGQATAQNPPQPLQPPADPMGNPSNPDKVMLGKVLYWDEQLSSTKTVACGTCHIMAQGGSDPRSTANNPQATSPGFDRIFNTADDVIGSPGVPESCHQSGYRMNELYEYQAQVTDRKSPSVINAGFADALFWDGRANEQLVDPLSGALILNSGAALENQVLGPPLSSIEMAHNGRSWTSLINDLKQAAPMALSPAAPQDLVDWINDQSYFELFQLVFGTPEITPSRIAMAIASYERSLFSNQTPFDAFIAGNNNALTPQERQGLNIFTRSRCAVCHAGGQLTDHEFHNIGLTPNFEDTGRFAVTQNPQDMGRFKTPGLRNLEARAPFMHNGSLATIEAVIDFYDRGGDVNNPNLDPNIRPLNLSPQEKNSLMAFLRRPMNDPRISNETGVFSSPMLYTEGDSQPRVSGSGVSGFNQRVPVINAFEPPLLGHDQFTIFLEQAAPLNTAHLVIDTQDPGSGGLPDLNSVLQVATIETENDSGNGHASFDVALPQNPQSAGITWFARWYIQDNQAVGGYAISPLLSFQLFAPNHGSAGLIFQAEFETPEVDDCDP